MNADRSPVESVSKDTAGNITHTEQWSADGSHVATSFDVSNTQPFQTQSAYLDAMNRVDKVDTLNDNGSKTLVDFDQNSSQSWSLQTTETSASDHVDAVETIADDGTFSLQTNNPDGTHAVTTSTTDGGAPTAAETDHYDAANRLLSETTHNDDGGTTLVTHDAAGAETWETQTISFDLGHNLKSEVIQYDDGWMSERVNDLEGAQPWAAAFSVTNASGQLEWQDVLNDDGSGVEYGFNHSGVGDFDFGDVGFYDGGGFGFGDFPVVLDLDGNGVDIALRGASMVAFDMVAFSPGREATSWVAGNDGLLAIDLGANGQAGADGVIDQAKEIVFTRWASTGSDMAALRAVFDTNQNNRLDAGDTRFGEFRVWRDANRNGVSEAGELLTLAQLGIVFLSLTTSGAALAFADGSGVNGLASYTRTDGTTGLAADATFAPAGDISADAAHTNALVNVKLGADGSTVSEITERDSLGNVLDHRITTVAGNAISVQADTNGDGRIDRLEASWTDGDGFKIVEQKELGIDGSVLVALKTKYDPGSTLAQSKTIAVSDAADVQNWSSRVSTYDAAGDLAFVAVENDDGAQVLTAYGSADRMLAGDVFNDTLTGASGDDVLYGGFGADAMAGGAGNDSYIIDDPADQVSESAGAGYDAIFTEIDYVLPANVEQVVLTGADDLDAVANALDDTLVGNVGDNQFTVGPGADRIIGGAGIDTVVFSGNRANYAISFDSTDTQAFTVTDLRSGSPDGIDTISGVEYFAFADMTVDTVSFATQTVTNPDGTHTVTATDVTDGLPWTTHVSTYDAANHLTAETFNGDNGSVWTNTYDTGNANWAWTTSNTDGNGNLISKMTTYDDDTHALAGHDNTEVNDWADFTVTFDAGWNIVVQSGIRDDGTALTSAEIAAAAETIAWYTHTVDPARDFMLS